MRVCPFCGYDEGWVKPFQSGSSRINKTTKYRVECKVCGTAGPASNTPKMAEWKWNGILTKIQDEEKFQEILDEGDLSGSYFDKMLMAENIGAPMATVTNVPGVGDATPAPSAATTASDMNSDSAKGSGDKWTSDKKPATQDKKKKKKKVTKKKK